MFGPLNRFDHHRRSATGDSQDDPDGRSVIYLGESLETCGAELFGELRTAVVCPNLYFGMLVPSSDVVVQDLRPSSVMELGAKQSLCQGDQGAQDRDQTQKWARAIYDRADSLVSGVLYPTSHMGGLALAIWDRAPDLLLPSSRGDVPLITEGFLTQAFTVEMAHLRVQVDFIRTDRCDNCIRHGLA